MENIEPDELLRRFGVGAADVPVPAPTAPLIAAGARAAEHAWTTAHLPVVRAGQAGNWAFAFEDAHHEGVRAPVLPRLSAGTRAVALYFWGPQLAVMQDGVLIASFSGFQPDRLYGQAPQALAAALAQEGVRPWDRFRSVAEHLTGLLAVLRNALGVEFDPAVLSGPLPGGPFLPDLPDRAVVTRGLSIDHGGQVAALTAFAPPDRLQRALVVQARTLASATGLTGYPEIAEALDRLAAGETWPVTGDSPLGLRFRLLAAEHAASSRANPWQHRSSALTAEDEAAWHRRFQAAEAIMELITGPPRRAARFVLGQRQDPGWPERFAADLGPVDMPSGAAAGTARRESEEHNRAHMGGAGYQVPVWPDRPTAWVSEPPRRPDDTRMRGIRGIH